MLGGRLHESRDGRRTGSVHPGVLHERCNDAHQESSTTTGLRPGKRQARRGADRVVQVRRRDVRVDNVARRNDRRTAKRYAHTLRDGAQDEYHRDCSIEATPGSRETIRRSYTRYLRYHRPKHAGGDRRSRAQW